MELQITSMRSKQISDKYMTHQKNENFKKINKFYF